MSERIISDQIDYYRARAGEYDEWFLRQGRFDHGRDFNRRWHPSSGPAPDSGILLSSASRKVRGIGIWIWQRRIHGGCMLKNEQLVA